MIAGARSNWSAFGQNKQGSIAMLWTLMFMMIAFAAGMAADYGRSTHMAHRIAAALDAAVLTGGRGMLDGRLSDAEVEQLALSAFQANLENVDGLFGTYSTPSVNLNRAAGELSMDVVATVPMTLTKIAGVSELSIPLASASKFDQRDVELGLALDVTGSMGGSKIADLRVAAKDLVEILLPDGGTTNSIRIGLAPYATSINAGAFANGVTGGASNACVQERGGSNAFTDAEPIGLDTLTHQAGSSCPTAVVQPLTDNKVALHAAIDTYNAGGWTAGHLGAAWAWYMISPNWSTVWPAASTPVAYGNNDTIKAVVLMTDGNFNTWYISGNGNSSNQAQNLCDEMKGKDVVVYSIAFQAGSSAQNLLQYCASSPDTYFPASSGSELRAAFQKIATDLNKLRLSY